MLELIPNDRCRVGARARFSTVVGFTGNFVIPWPLYFPALNYAPLYSEWLRLCLVFILNLPIEYFELFRIIQPVINLI